MPLGRSYEYIHRHRSVNVREDLKSEQIGEMQVHYVKEMTEVEALALEKKEG